MKFTPPKEQTEYTESTKYCNANDPKVISKAEELTKNAKNPTEAALNAGVFSPANFPTVEWDGKDDLNIVGHWQQEDRGTLACYDQVVEEVVESFKAMPNWMFNWLAKGSNRYTANFRKRNGQKA